MRKSYTQQGMPPVERALEDKINIYPLIGVGKQAPTCMTPLCSDARIHGLRMPCGIKPDSAHVLVLVHFLYERNHQTIYTKGRNCKGPGNELCKAHRTRDAVSGTHLLG